MTLIKPDAGSTHSVVREKLLKRKNTGQVDIEKLTAVAYPLIDETFYVGPMTYEDHRSWHDMRKFEDRQHAEFNKTEEDPVDRARSDAFLLAKAVYTSDGELAGEEMAAELLGQLGGGPDNHRLISEAEKVNPPREHLATEVAMLLNTRSMDYVLWRLLIEGGLVKVLIDYMSTNSSPEEYAWAERELVKVEEVVYAFQPMFNCEELAKATDITFRQSLSLIAQHGSVEKAMEEVEKIRNAPPEEEVIEEPV